MINPEQDKEIKQLKLRLKIAEEAAKKAIETNVLLLDYIKNLTAAS